MAKRKTHKSTIKRFKITKTGKLKHEAAGASHLMVKKSARVKNRKSSMRVLAKSASKAVMEGIHGVSFKK